MSNRSNSENGKHSPEDETGTEPVSRPKVTPVPLAEMSERTREAMSRALLDREGEPLTIFTTIARHPKLFVSWIPFASRLLAGGTLERRLTELVILRVAWNMRSDYEWGQHAEISAALGIPRADIDRIPAGPQASGWSPLEALVLAATDELHSGRRISDRTWAELRRYCDDTQLIELCFLVGHYEMLAMFLTTVGVQLERGKEPLPLPQMLADSSQSSSSP
jgi:4-carboxymuconolactone decarboxylase